ncbi:hypothetical protein DACRYDRAFT_21007 [Dacryopinax primogenitus]|uniref:Uncharacterized protein n=1 Tax=Dacryopinax primogenitus (strain DJM 731) TaxID=1858805 RepID=M5G2M6_DACPD|nr:uncharacterized protein DACRYDRAFT_21007 [Dacryopinax primogenitus]EJU04476.1 hypothetical protein DACRYDRAFT_21007 [Dacryopinax primogenitus]
MYGQNVRRNEEAIVVYLTQHDSIPPCPPELRPHMSEGDWSYRLSTVNRLVKRYSKPRFEKAWFGLGLLATFIAPIIIYHYLFSVVTVNENSTLTTKVVELHLIGFGIFVAVCFLFWTPLAIWKGVGALKVRKVIEGFQREDAARQSSQAARFHWKVHLPGIFGTQASVSITLPTAQPFTSFDPNGQLPPYIAAYPAPAYMDAEDRKDNVVLYHGASLDIKDPLQFDGEQTSVPRHFDEIDLGHRV